MSDEKLKFELRKAIPVEGQEVKILELRRPCARDFRVMDGVQGEVAKNIALMARLADVPPSSIDALDGADYLKINAHIQSFQS